MNKTRKWINYLGTGILICGIFLFIEGLFDVVIQTRLGFVPINTLSGLVFMNFGLYLLNYKRGLKQ